MRHIKAAVGISRDICLCFRCQEDRLKERYSFISGFESQIFDVFEAFQLGNDCTCLVIVVSFTRDSDL